MYEYDSQYNNFGAADVIKTIFFCLKVDHF